MTEPVDLLIVGGGPAGLSAAINAASEGLSVRIMDNGSMLGGQARESSAIENYPGFPEGISGNELMSRFVQQAHKFSTGFFCPCHGTLIGVEDGLIRITTDDYQEHLSRTVLLSLGLNYRRLDADNIGQFIGRGVHYGVPSWDGGNKTRVVAVIGGANSAGQAVVNLAQNPKTQVKLLVRKELGVQMSQYLVDRIVQLGNVEVLEHCEVSACRGKHRLNEVEFYDHGETRTLQLDAMYVFIGAIPKTMWVDGMVALDKGKFVLTDGPLPYATTCRGVFAAGDVRSGSTKRIATAIGEGVGALQSIHKYLSDNR